MDERGPGVHSKPQAASTRLPGWRIIAITSSKGRTEAAAKLSSSLLFAPGSYEGHLGMAGDSEHLFHKGELASS